MIKRIRRYFLSSARFLEAYQMENCTDENVMVYYKYIKAIQGLSTIRKRHRGGENLEHGDEDEEPRPRKKLKKSFLSEFGDATTNQNAQVNAPEVEPQPGPSGVKARPKRKAAKVNSDSDSDMDLSDTDSDDDLPIKPKKPISLI